MNTTEEDEFIQLLPVNNLTSMVAFLGHTYPLPQY